MGHSIVVSPCGVNGSQPHHGEPNGPFSLMRALLLHGKYCYRSLDLLFLVRVVPAGLNTLVAHPGRPARCEKANFVTAWLCQQVISLQLVHHLWVVRTQDRQLLERQVLA